MASKRRAATGTTPLTRTLYRNGAIFTADGDTRAEAMVVAGDRLEYVGDEESARRVADGAEEIDLGGAFVLPGFIDAHTHLMMMGQAMQKVELREATDLAEIQRRLSKAVAYSPDADRILGCGWLLPAIPNGKPTRQMIDEVLPDKPVYLDSNDVHSMWVNSAALAEMGITRDTPDPVGGKIERDPVTGEATGLLLETAVMEHAWPTLARMASDADRDAHLASAFEHYLSTGVTAGIDMAMGEDDLAAMRRALAAEGQLPLRVTGHWLISPSGTPEDALRQVERAVALNREVTGPWLRIAGIKLVVDGVIDSCTAAMKEPYADGSKAGLIWELEALIPVVTAADAAGLQIAMHAIGDEASQVALDALEHAHRINGDCRRRHRMEHLETITRDNITRLAAMGVVASMQPVHSDPAIQGNWQAMLGDHRTERAYPWTEFTEAGAVLALGTDAPTAPHPPLPNMYVATTRKSALDPSLPANIPAYALGLADALCHATRDAAFSCGMERDMGRLATGLYADFVVLDADPFAAGPESLLSTSVSMTVVGGQTRYRA